jgi:hypothetical protein
MNEFRSNLVKTWISNWEVDIFDKRIDLEVLAQQMFESEDNYNNCDPTTNQYILSEDEIYNTLMWEKTMIDTEM